MFDNIGCEYKIIGVVIVVFLIMAFLYPRHEGFDKSGVEIVDLYERDYDLRGEPIRSSCMLDNYKKCSQNIILIPGGMMRDESNRSPQEQGLNGYTKVKCPVSEWNNDVCWIKDSAPYKVNIPLIHSHVPN